MSGRVPATLAERLNHLFAVLRPEPDDGSGQGREYTNEQVASHIRSSSGVSISQSYIWQLRKGKKDNPTLRHLQALADFFGVPAAYFFDPEVTDRVDVQLRALTEERARRELNRSGGAADQVAVMAMRAGELSPPRRQQVMDLLELVCQLEQAERAAGSSGG